MSTTPHRCETAGFGPLLPVMAVLVLVAVGAAAQPAPAGPPFLVGTDVSTTPAPELLVGPRGEAVFLWVGECPDPGLCGRAYAADGTALGPATALATDTPVFDRVPAGVFAGDGTFVLVWSRPGAGFERRIVARRYGLDLAPRGEDWDVAAGSTLVWDEPAVARDADGNLVAAFTRLRFDGYTGTGEDRIPTYTGVEIHGRRLTPAGRPLGARFRVDGESPDLVGAPAVAAGGAGSFLVAWESFDFVSAEDDVLARRFLPEPAGDASPTGDEFRTHSRRQGVQRAPAAAATPEGTFLVTWEEEPEDGSDPRARAQVFDASGPRFPADVGLGTGAAAQRSPDASGSDDAFAVTWLDDRHGGSVYADLLDHRGIPLGEELRVDAPAEGDPLRSVVGAYGGPGADAGLVVGWSRREPDFSRRVLGRRYPATGVPPGAPCVAGANTHCLNGGRFEVTTAYTTVTVGTTGEPASGLGRAGEDLTDDTGYFWFFDSSNVEVVVKVLDGCAVNGHWWVFAAGLTNVEVDLLVRDTGGVRSKLYENELGEPFQPIQDTGAFPCTVLDPPPPAASRR